MLTLLQFFMLFITSQMKIVKCSDRWSTDKANDWYDQNGFLVGPNFTPSTAENTLEFWQKETFDMETISRELKWVSDHKMNSVRVFLHYLVFQNDATGYFERLEAFLTMADQFNLRVMFVLFDDCWDPDPKLGPQLPPRPHIHNSRWVQCPGKAISNLGGELMDSVLKEYVQQTISHFRNDHRVIIWDLYNEPGNLNPGSYNDPPSKLNTTLSLLRNVFKWAREINPQQPLTTPIFSSVVYNNYPDIQKLQLFESDVVTYHQYGDVWSHQKYITTLRTVNPDRPLICSEYMARPLHSTFQTILLHLYRQNIGAFNWGWVNGKTQVIYPWDSWNVNYTKPPDVWFHAVIHKNGSPFDSDETFLMNEILPAAPHQNFSLKNKLYNFVKFVAKSILLD